MCIFESMVCFSCTQFDSLSSPPSNSPPNTGINEMDSGQFFGQKKIERVWVPFWKSHVMEISCAAVTIHFFTVCIGPSEVIFPDSTGLFLAGIDWDYIFRHPTAQQALRCAQGYGITPKLRLSKTRNYWIKANFQGSGKKKLNEHESQKPRIGPACCGAFESKWETPPPPQTQKEINPKKRAPRIYNRLLERDNW